MSLVEVMIGSALLGGMTLAMLSLNTIQSRSLQGQQTISSRDNIKTLIERYASNRNLLKNTLDHDGFAANRELSYCVRGVKPDDPAAPGPAFPECPSPHVADQKCCPHTKDTGARPFFLLDPSDANKKEKFAGTDTDPVRFDQQGVRCTQASASCAFEVVTRFHSLCAGEEATCAKAESLMIQYEIRRAKDLAPSPGSIFKEIKGEFALSLRELRSTAASSDGGGPKENPFEDGNQSPTEVCSNLFKREIYNGNYNLIPVQEGVSEFIVTVVGGGGGGSGGTRGFAAKDKATREFPKNGAGGASGCAIKQARLKVKAGDFYSVSVGHGGGGGDAYWSDGDPGSNGGNSSFALSSGFQIIASGGGGGSKAVYESTSPPVPGVVDCAPVVGEPVLAPGLAIRNNGEKSSGGASPYPDAISPTYIQNFGAGGSGGGDGKDFGYKITTSGSIKFTDPGVGSDGHAGTSGIVIIEYMLPKK